jgi:prepilin peptidase dependent protein B
MLAKTATGLSLLELIIGLLVGSIVVTGGLKIYSNSVADSSENIDTTALTQDLRTMLELMLHDLRRSGYVSSNPDTNADGLPDILLKNNPFAPINVENSGTCIVYAYNRNSNDLVENNERFGFKLGTDTSFSPPKKVLRVRRSSTSEACTSGTWENITGTEIEITQLNFSLNEFPLNVTAAIDHPSDPVQQSCSTGEKCLYIRTVTIQLSGRLKDKPKINQTLSGSIRIRNDRYLSSAP